LRSSLPTTPEPRA